MPVTARLEICPPLLPSSSCSAPQTLKLHVPPILLEPIPRALLPGSHHSRLHSLREGTRLPMDPPGGLQDLGSPLLLWGLVEQCHYSGKTQCSIVSLPHMARPRAMSLAIIPLTPRTLSHSRSHVPPWSMGSGSSRPRLTRDVTKRSGLCTHVLSGVPGFSLIPLEARVAFGALQVMKST